MHVAVVVAQRDRPHRDRLHHARLPAKVHDVADLHRVADQDEQAGDQVLDQGLRPEADREAHDAGAGEQRIGVHAELESTSTAPIATSSVKARFRAMLTSVRVRLE